MRSFKLCLIAIFSVALICWIRVSISLWPLVGSAALLYSPAVMVAETTSFTQEAISPAAVFTLDLCESGVSANHEPGRARDISSEAASNEPYFEYRGRKFSRSGDNWQGGRAVARLSPDERSLALISFSGPTNPSGLYFFYPGQKWWNTYIDAYEVASGRKLAALAWTRRLGPEPLAMNAAWGTESQLIYSGADSVSGFCRTSGGAVYFADFAGATAVLDNAAGANATIRLQPVDANKNGLIDAIAVDADFVATEPAAYLLSARFERPNAPAGSNSSASAEVVRTLPAGPAHLSVEFDPAELASLAGSSPVVLSKVEIRGADFRIASRDRYSFPDLPPTETIPFRNAGLFQTWEAAQQAGGSFQFLTPAGLCAWSGEVVQGERKVPFSGQSQLEQGRNDITFMVQSSGLFRPQGPKPMARLLSMSCSGRTAHLRSGGAFLAEAQF